MEKFIYDKTTCDGWKSYPIRIIVPDRVCKCHGTRLVLVQSMEGGFVTANCFECNKKELIGENELKKLPIVCCCPKCNKVMTGELVEKNFCYTCKNCNLYIRLADLLPHWSDLSK